ncbi:MAG: peptidoglycan DD-metalloendopeptidase family protein [Brumimicrobium sp.]|nr:peptidoglycan DD-metalloendopeptidase family protein [Brumimicrobium sp.]
MRNRKNSVTKNIIRLAKVALLVATISLLTFCNSTSKNISSNYPADTLKIQKQMLFGFDLNLYDVHYDTVKSGWTWNNLFADFEIGQHAINQLVERLRDNLFGMKYIVAGKPFAVFKPKTKNKSPLLVYETDALSYVTMQFEDDTVKLNKAYRPVELVEKTISGTIAQNSNLSNELNKQFSSYNMTATISEAIEGIYGWSIDFFKLQVGDKFITVFDEQVVDGVPYKIDRIKYIWFEHAGKGLYAFYYNDSINGVTGYYDEAGNEMKRPFLMAPVQYSRISSGFSASRFHPVQKRFKAHLGTDYAAPTGTPIQATADGTIEKAARSEYNGIFVKIRHNSVYETQYLHMSKIADGIRPGVRVKQGQTIGYVGQTGLATGPHVCYRFWKNGQQIDHRAETFPKSEPMKESAKPAYLEYISPLKENIDKEIVKIKKVGKPVV